MGAFSRRAEPGSARSPGMRDHGAHLDDGADRSRAGSGADLPRRPSLRCARSSSPSGPDELELVPDRLREHERLQPQHHGGGRQLGRLGPSAERRRAGSAVASRSVTVRRHEPPPTRRAGKRELAQGPPTAFLPGEQPVDEHAERAPQRELVADRLRKLERLDQLRRRACARARAASSRLSPGPGAPAVRPQSFGDGATRKPGKLAKPLDSPAPSAPRCRCARVRSRSIGSGARNSCVRSSRDDERLPRRARRSPQPARRTSATPRPRARPSRLRPLQRPLQRRLEPAVEPLDPAGLEVRACPARPESTAKPASSSARTIPSHASSAAAGSGSTSCERRARRERLPSRMPGCTPAVLGDGGHRPEQRLGPRLRRERRRRELQPGRSRSATRSSNPGMTRRGDHGNVCSTRTHVPCQEREWLPRPTLGA